MKRGHFEMVAEPAVVSLSNCLSNRAQIKSFQEGYCREPQ